MLSIINNLLVLVKVSLRRGRDFSSGVPTEEPPSRDVGKRFSRMPHSTTFICGEGGI